MVDKATADNRILTRIDIEASHTLTAQVRLGYAVERIGEREALLRASFRGLEATASAAAARAALRWTGPPFEVHVWGAAGDLVEDAECLSSLVHIARHGLRVSVVVFWHGDLDEITGALAARSGALATALAVGEVFRYVSPPAGREPSDVQLQATPTCEAEASAYSDAVSAEVWAALLQGSAVALARIFDGIEAASKAGQADLVQRRLLSDALRRAADCVLPGAGGMLPGGLIGCPLCLAEPLLRPDEMPSHLAGEHGALRPAEAQP